MNTAVPFADAVTSNLLPDDTSESMKQIAYSLGFDNPAHFSKFFKNNCGVNFTEYKNQLQRV